MYCPTCSKTLLRSRLRLGLSLQICPACQGAWLTRDTIEQLSRTTGLFLKQRSALAEDVRPRPGLRRPLWQELFDAEA